MNKTRIRMCIVGGIIGGLLGFSISMTHNYMRTKEELKISQQQLEDYQADEAEIYPCPFCGSEAVELKESCGWYVRCEDCGAIGPLHDPSDIWDENTKAEAIEWWNHNARE